MWHIPLIALITLLAPQYGVDTQEALQIAECESQYGKYDVNWETGKAKGVFQFMPTTWNAYCEGDVMSEFDNTKCFLELYPKHPTWWDCAERLN